MKLTLRVVGVLLLLMGTVWFLQGLSVLPGGFMSGQTPRVFMRFSASRMTPGDDTAEIQASGPGKSRQLTADS